MSVTETAIVMMRSFRSFQYSVDSEKVDYLCNAVLYLYA